MFLGVILFVFQSRLCVMLTLQLENPFPLTRGTMLPRYSAILMLLLKNPGIYCFSIAVSSNHFYFSLSDYLLLHGSLLGTVLSRNTPCCRKKWTGLLGGLLVVSLDLRWVLTFIDVFSLRIVTSPFHTFTQMINVQTYWD